MSEHPIFHVNKVGVDIVVVRSTDLPTGKRPVDVLGDGVLSFRAPHSEFARSLYSMHLSKLEAA